MRFAIPPDYPHRTLRRFAWLPVRLTGGGWVWWEHYEVCQFWWNDYDGWVTTVVRVKP